MVKNCSILTEQIASISTHGNDMERQGSWSNLFYFDEARFSIYINRDKKDRSQEWERSSIYAIM